jgi:hypothetical protein
MTSPSACFTHAISLPPPTSLASCSTSTARLRSWFSSSGSSHRPGSSRQCHDGPRPGDVTDAETTSGWRSGSRPTGPISGARPHDPRPLSDRVIQRERADPTWAGPFDDAFPAGASASIEASSGRPTGTREVGELVGFCRLPGERAGAGGPGPRGTAQQPVTSRVSSCFGKDHPLSPVHAWCGRTRGKATNEVTTISGGRVARTTERTRSGCQPRNRYPAPRTVSTTSRRSFLRRYPT